GRLTVKTAAARGVKACKDTAIRVIKRELLALDIPGLHAIKRGGAAQRSRAIALAKARLRRGDTAALTCDTGIPHARNGAGGNVRCTLLESCDLGVLGRCRIRAGGCRELGGIAHAGLGRRRQLAARDLTRGSGNQWGRGVRARTIRRKTLALAAG